MADAIVQCDSCGELARRRPGHPCPDHWLFLESIDRTPGAPRSVYIVWACSAECRDKLWQRGPGGDTLKGASRPKRTGKPGRGGLGGARIAQLEAALKVALDVWKTHNDEFEGSTTGINAGNGEAFEHCQRVLDGGTDG